MGTMKGKSEDRAARLAARLRDNLKRRKQQARARADDAKDTGAHSDSADSPEGEAGDKSRP
ncbi:hypothetical protein [Cucumibacter marinus]|uniref:hypothetical protein n=1 Tax=Cucumibacter marinus TaxID=1121252 RepID=UPI000418489A|nr:hypothetical protein [Cucumibacter marinus]